MEGSKAEDPRVKSNRYSTQKKDGDFTEAKDFLPTEFEIDDNYVGEPPHIQVGIDNLNDNINGQFLSKELSKLGKIRELRILRHPATSAHLGLARVVFHDVKVADECVATYNGRQMMGKQLSVFKDVRFALLEKIKEAKLNPRPNNINSIGQLPTSATQIPISSMIPQTATPITPHLPRLHGNGFPLPPPPSTIGTNASILQSNDLPPNTLLPHTPTNSHHSTIASIHSVAAHHQLHKSNSIGSLSSPISSDYPVTTPGSAGSLSATPEPSGRQRLEDRIAKLLKQPNNALSSIAGPPSVAMPSTTAQVPTNYHSQLTNQPTLPPHHHRSFSSSSRETSSYANSSSHYHGAPTQPFNKLRSEREADSRRPEINNHYHKDNNHRYHHGRSPKHSRNNSHTSDRYSDDSSDDGWNTKAKPVEIPRDLTEDQIHREILPCIIDYFRRDMDDVLFMNIFKRLKEQHGYPCIEKAQAAHRAKLDEAKRKADQERNDREKQRQLEKIYMSRNRINREVEPARPRINIVRQRMPHSDESRPSRDDQRRVPVNRSSTFVGGSHSSVDSDFSDEDKSSESSHGRRSRSSSSSSSSSGSSASSRSSSRSSSSSTGSSSSFSSESSSIKAKRTKKKKKEIKFSSPEPSGSESDPEPSFTEPVPAPTENELDVALSLIELGHAPKPQEPKVSETSTVEPSTKKRKKKGGEILGFASEFRSAKKFAAGAQQHLYDGYSASTYDDENFQEKPEAKFIFPERTDEEKKRLLDDLYGTLSEEDIKYLAQVHEREGINRNNEVEVPFGSETANKAHLAMRKQMIEGKAAEGHPKWWRGCSRCDVIKVSDKGKMDVEETNYEDLTRAPIRSHMIQAVTSSRRDNRGDQRRIATLNADLDPELIKMYTTNTLQMRAKNLRFSRSKIHKWGLFACEKIASGDAVIEYVGEKIRPSLADHRENIVYTNLPTHDGSSYFFRVDHDVIDATLKGNKARFINHSCNPNCIAKVIKHDNGTNSIVIYAKQAIQEDEEITYDYKFPREENKIRCMCKAPNCQKYLN